MDEDLLESQTPHVSSPSLTHLSNLLSLRIACCNTKMAPTSNGVCSRTQSLLDFAKYLQHALSQSIADLPILATHVEALTSSPLHDGSHEDQLQLHKTGVELWNKCRLDDYDESTHSKTLLAQGTFHATLRLPCSY
jgi:hypothetical protein